MLKNLIGLWFRFEKMLKKKFLIYSTEVEIGKENEFLMHIFIVIATSDGSKMFYQVLYHVREKMENLTNS